MSETTTQPYTLQSLFDLAWQKFVVEKQPASYDRAIDYCESGCRYRGPDGRRCIIGWAIPDDRYDPDMEGRSARAIARMVPGLFADDLDRSQLNALQKCHDSAARDAATGSEFQALVERRLRAYAQEESLVIPESPNA